MAQGAITVITIVAILMSRPFAACGAGPVRVGVPSPSASYFPLIVAAKKGFYAQDALQPELIMMRPSIIPAALTNGEIQYTTATGTAAGAILRGFPFKIVIYFSTRPMDSLVV